MLNRKWLLVFFIFAMPLVANAQDLDARSPKPDKSSTKLQKKAEKKKEDRKAKEVKSDKQNLKHSMNLQSRETKKRMKKSKKKANSWNANERKGGIFKRWFGKKN